MTVLYHGDSSLMGSCFRITLRVDFFFFFLLSHFCSLVGISQLSPKQLLTFIQPQSSGTFLLLNHKAIPKYQTCFGKAKYELMDTKYQSLVSDRGHHDSMTMSVGSSLLCDMSYGCGYGCGFGINFSPASNS